MIVARFYSLGPTSHLLKGEENALAAIDALALLQTVTMADTENGPDRPNFEVNRYAEVVVKKGNIKTLQLSTLPVIKEPNGDIEDDSDEHKEVIRLKVV